MERIYSKSNTEQLLHVVFRGSEAPAHGRIDLTPDAEGLQVAYLGLKDEQTFKAHKHIPRPRTIEQTQETWIVVRGEVEVFYFDLDDTPLGSRILQPGDITITLAGGHNYAGRAESSLVVECKTGPFVGVEADKVLLPV